MTWKKKCDLESINLFRREKEERNQSSLLAFLRIDYMCNRKLTNSQEEIKIVRDF